MSALDILKMAQKSKKAKPALLGGAGLLGMALPFTRDLILNELLGVDDFKRALKYADEGEFGKMLKSLGAGTFELGSTVIPGGQILKGAKAGKLVANASPIGGRIISRIPGLTADAGLNAGGRYLTNTGRQALQGFRAAEAAQIADAVNSGAQMFTGRSANIGSARGLRREEDLARQREMLLRFLTRGEGARYAF